MRTTTASVVGCLVVFVTTASGTTLDPKRLVLRLQDVPAGFQAVGAGYMSVAAATKDSFSPGPLDKVWGYVSGYEAGFSKNGGLIHPVKGAGAILSLASVYRTATGASKSVAASAKTCATAPWQELSVGARIGDEAHLCALTRKTGSVTLQGYAVLWRRGRVKAAVILGGIKGGASPTEAVRLAGLQDKRMRESSA